MARRMLAGAIAAAALAAVGAAAARRLPILRSATVVRHHLVLRISVGDARPTALTVAGRRALGVHGELLRKNVRLQEAIRLPASATGVVRWRSGKRLRRGIYFVQVTAVETGGMTDCPRFSPDCNVRRSNVRRVVVRRSS